MKVEERNGQIWILTVVYIRPNNEDKQEFWDEMLSFSNSNLLPWVMIGDFNDYAFQEEKLGGVFLTSCCEQFCGRLDCCGLSYLGVVGRKFTW